MNHDDVLHNRAQLRDAEGQANAEQCDAHHLLFALRDQHHEFSLDITTVLQCLQFAESQGVIPDIPEDWWIAVRGRYFTALVR